MYIVSALQDDGTCYKLYFDLLYSNGNYKSIVFVVNGLNARP